VQIGPDSSGDPSKGAGDGSLEQSLTTITSGQSNKALLGGKSLIALFKRRNLVGSRDFYALQVGSRFKGLWDAMLDPKTASLTPYANRVLYTNKC
jgi:hypothetical protein